MKIISLFFGLLMLSASCDGNENEQVSAIPIERVTDNAAIEITANTPVDFATDWELFKQYAKAKNHSELATLCTAEISDVEGLSFLLSELYILRAMDQTSYSALKRVEEGNKIYIQFYAEEVGVDEEGYDVGTSVTLLFLETDQGLRLDQYIAAG